MITTPRTWPSASITGAPESPGSTGTEISVAERSGSPSSSWSAPVRPSRPVRTAGTSLPRAGPSSTEPTPKPIVATGVPMLADSSSASAGAAGRSMRIATRSAWSLATTSIAM